MKKAGLLLAAISIGCASAEAPRPSAGKSEGPSAGSDVLVLAATASSRPPRPARGGDVSLRAYAPSPVSPLTSDALDDYVVGIEIVSRSSDPVAVVDGRISIAVLEGERLARGCEASAEPRALERPILLDPHASEVVPVPLPCALPRLGRYTLRVTLESGREDEVLLLDATTRTELEIR